MNGRNGCARKISVHVTYICTEDPECKYREQEDSSFCRWKDGPECRCERAIVAANWNARFKSHGNKNPAV